MKNSFIISGLLAALLTQAGCQKSDSSSTAASGGVAMSCPINSDGKDQPTPGAPSDTIDFVPASTDLEKYDNYIVKFKNSDTASGASGNTVREYAVAGLTIKATSSDKTYTFNISGSADQKRVAIEKLMAQQNVEFIEPDYPVSEIDQAEDLSTQAMNDEMFSSQWHHKTVQSEKAWQITTGNKDIVVAVVDSGIDYTHPDLKDNMWVNPGEVAGNNLDDDGNGLVDDIYGWNYASNNNNPKSTSTSNHGTHVAGIIGAKGNNGIGVVGATQNVRLMALKFIGENGTGSTSAAINAINYAVKKKVFAINNSWGGSGKSQALSDAITRAEQAGILFVVAAGNNSSNLDTSNWYPAAFTHSNILTVASTTSTDAISSFSNWGINKVDVAAPGSAILSTVSGNAYQKMSGTSMSSPYVAGLAALVKSANMGLSALEVKRIIMGTVDPLSNMTNKIVSGGRVNAYKAVVKAASTNSGSPELAPCP